MRSFKEFIVQKNLLLQEEKGNKEWRKEYVKLEKGFIPPKNLRRVVDAFLNSGSIELTNDTSSKVTLPKKSLFLVGGPVRDFLMGKTPKDLDLATNATPDQIALILHSAGFKYIPKPNSEKLKLSFEPVIATDNDNEKYYLKGVDSSGKPFVIGAIVNGEEFDIATFRKDAKTINGKSEVDFVDNPHEDAERRDLTINSLYIELTKSDGENNKLYDPTRQGYHDVHNGNVRTVGKAEDRFNEDKLRVLRAVRFLAKFGKDKKLDDDIVKSIPKFRDLEGVALERIRDEFVKGLLDPDIDPKKYLMLYNKFDLLGRVLPGVSLNVNVPPQLRDKKDKFLALAWILQDNPIEKVEQVLGTERQVGDKTLLTGWSNQEREMVVYLLRLKEFDTNNLEEFLSRKKILGVTKDQIKKWVELFDVVDGDQVKSLRPNWSKRVNAFADFTPDTRKLVSWFAKDDQGNPTKEVHPEIVSKNLHNVPNHFRGSVLKDLNREHLKQMFRDRETL
jgi:tRNA nucleotidyltransferase/poly(A) polymerase